LTRGYNLFTGKVAYLFDNDNKYALKLAWMWFGNFIGALTMAIGIRNTHIYAKISEKATGIIATKTGQGYLSAFILAALCGVIIFLSVENYKNNPHELGKYLGLVFLIPLFIVCGFEHCVANMFYFSLTSELMLDKIIYSLIITLGNTCGSVIANRFKKWK
jgi:formate/nitrite transporter FocA (FNT family)